jgi:hypothetical protein
MQLGLLSGLNSRLLFWKRTLSSCISILLSKINYGDRKIIAISAGFAVPPEYWNVKNREIKKTYNGVSSVHRLNNLLTKKKTDLRDGINSLEENLTLDSLSIADLKNILTKSNKSIYFFEYAQ